MEDIKKYIQKVFPAGKQIPNQSTFIHNWLDWYRGKVFGFHNYRIYNGERYLELERKSLQMAKYISEAWANLLMNEKCDIIIPEKDKEQLDEILNATNFWVKANEGVEKSFALGKGAFVLNVTNLEVGEKTGKVRPTDKTKLKIDFVNALKIYPITIENKQVTECAFVSKNSDTTNIVIHKKDDNGRYEIHNFVVDDKGKTKDEYVFPTGSDIPWFFIIRPNISNNLMTESVDDEIGISIYANAIDTLKAIDNKYDGFDLEYVLGRKRMFVSSEAWTINQQNGEMRKTFDPYDVLFYQMPDNDEGKPIITEKSDELRYNAYIEGLNAELNILSMKCGMGETYFKFDGSGVSTATQIISENSTLYRSIKKHEIILEDVLRNLTKAIIYASNEFTNIKFSDIKDEEIVIQFDDSIIEDKETEMARDRADVSAGLMHRVEYRMKWYGEDEKTASKKNVEYFLYDDLEKYSNALTEGYMTPEQFVDKCYPKVGNREEIIEYITNFLTTSPQLDMNSLYLGNETGDRAYIDSEDVSESEVDDEDETEA